ncbi:7938_t:CDS:10 [Paraglomus occultum]|uniref:7938_t:CDS:1 n=1 Tax=Paraglomus occultum TaxID=144539 RepID=A0A9N9GRG4_9GLOM|nr:7938_t:CDS:10 [Paraglomus occultum]
MASANEKSPQTKKEFLRWLTKTKKWPDVADKVDEFEWEDLLSFDERTWEKEFGAMRAQLIEDDLSGYSKKFRAYSLPAPWLAGPPINDSFRDCLTKEFRLLNKVAFDQACKTLRCPRTEFDLLQQHPAFICILDGPGVGKSRFIYEAAKEAKAFILRTSFEYGILKSVIDEADNHKYHYALAETVVLHLCHAFRTAFVTIFDRASEAILSFKKSGDPPLEITLTKNFLPNYEDEDIKELMGKALDELKVLLDGTAMVIIMDEAQCMGPPPGKLRNYGSVQELISNNTRTYPKMDYIDDEVMPTPKHFVSIALHLVLQEVVPMGLSRNIAIAVLGLDPTLNIHKALARSGLTTFSFCQDIAKTLPYFTYKDVMEVVGQYIDLNFYPPMEIAPVIAQLTGPPRITEIFLETCWQKRRFRFPELMNDTFFSFCSRYNLSNVKGGENMLRLFFKLTYFPTQFGGSIIYEDMNTVVEYHDKSEGYHIIAKYHRQMSVIGIVRVQLFERVASKVFQISEPYPFAYRALREVAGYKNLKEPIVGSLMNMKEMGGELFEYAVGKELSFRFSPIYGRILRMTGYDVLPNLEQMVFEPFNTIETRNDSSILDENHQTVRWIHDKNSRDTMKVDVWTFGYNDKPAQDLPPVIDIFVQVTKQKDGVDQKLDETLRHWLCAVPILHEAPAILVFISWHPVTIPGCVKLEDNGRVTYIGVQTRNQQDQMKEKGPQHWLLVFSGAELNNTVVPLLALVDNPPADIKEKYNFE